MCLSPHVVPSARRALREGHTGHEAPRDLALVRCPSRHLVVTRPGRLLALAACRCTRSLRRLLRRRLLYRPLREPGEPARARLAQHPPPCLHCTCRAMTHTPPCRDAGPCCTHRRHLTSQLVVFCSRPPPPARAAHLFLHLLVFARDHLHRLGLAWRLAVAGAAEHTARHREPSVETRHVQPTPVGCNQPPTRRLVVRRSPSSPPSPQIPHAKVSRNCASRINRIRPSPPHSFRSATPHRNSPATHTPTRIG